MCPRENCPRIVCCMLRLNLWKCTLNNSVTRVYATVYLTSLIYISFTFLLNSPCYNLYSICFVYALNSLNDCQSITIN